MRSVSGFLTFLILALAFTTSAHAQTASNAANVPDSVLRSLTLSPKFPEFAKNLSSDQSSHGESQNETKPELNLQKRAQDFLHRALDRNLMSDSGECGHILIYVPPITDTKMIIKVPENPRAPDNAPIGRATPSVRVCGQDLRRVDAPHPPPQSSKDGKPSLVPVHQPADPR